MVGYVRKFIYFLFALSVMGIIIMPIFARSGGAPLGDPYFFTGSRHDNFQSCRVEECHNSFVLNSGTATFSISAPSNYTLGEVVSITVSFNNSDTPKHGFQLTALDADEHHIGELSSVDNKTYSQTFDNRYITHTSAGSDQSGNASWTVQWTAPSSEVNDPVTFHAAGCEADGDGTPSGDYVYTTASSEMSQPTTTTTTTSTTTTTTSTTTTTQGGGGGGGGGGGTSTPTPISTVTTTASPIPTSTATLPPLPTPTLSPLPTPISTGTITPLPTPISTPTPTPLECKVKSIVVIPGKLELKKGGTAEVSVTVLMNAEGCPPKEGAKIRAAVRGGKKSISVSPKSKITSTSHGRGVATFIITAKNKKGNTKVLFRYKNFKKTLKVKVVK